MVRALGMRVLAWRQGTSKRIENIRKRFSSRGIVQTPRALHTGGLNLVLLPQPLIAMPGHRLRPFYGPSHYQRRPGHHQAITKPALATTGCLRCLLPRRRCCSCPWRVIVTDLNAIPNERGERGATPHSRLLCHPPSHLVGNYPTQFDYYHAATKPPLVTTKPL